jgi:putative FmdB family regulatory protein
MNQAVSFLRAFSSHRAKNASFCGVEPRAAPVLESRCWRLAMQYEYRCADCKKTFTRTQTLAEHDKGKIECPECGSKKVEQTYSSFYAVTSKKSA